MSSGWFLLFDIVNFERDARVTVVVQVIATDIHVHHILNTYICYASA